MQGGEGQGASGSPITIESLERLWQAIQSQEAERFKWENAESERRMKMVPEGLWEHPDVTQEERTLVRAWIWSPRAIMHPERAKQLASTLEAIFAKVDQ